MNIPDVQLNISDIHQNVPDIQFDERCLRYTLFNSNIQFQVHQAEPPSPAWFRGSYWPWRASVSPGWRGDTLDSCLPPPGPACGGWDFLHTPTSTTTRSTAGAFRWDAHSARVNRYFIGDISEADWHLKMSRDMLKYRPLIIKISNIFNTILNVYFLVRPAHLFYNYNNKNKCVKKCLW